MAIDAEKMAAFVNEGSPPPEGEELEGEGELEEGGMDKYTALIPLLTEFKDDVTEMTDEMDADILMDSTMDMGPDDTQILSEGYQALDRKLNKELAATAGGISSEDSASVAEAVAEEDGTDDPDRLGGWLFRIGEMIGPGEGEDMIEDEETPPEEEEEIAPEELE